MSDNDQVPDEVAVMAPVRWGYFVVDRDMWEQIKAGSVSEGYAQAQALALAVIAGRARIVGTTVADFVAAKEDQAA